MYGIFADQLGWFWGFNVGIWQSHGVFGYGIRVLTLPKLNSRSEQPGAEAVAPWLREGGRAGPARRVGEGWLLLTNGRRPSASPGVPIQIPDLSDFVEREDVHVA